ncbi:hypothetical protein OG792_16705 [Micromonospora sp. NBC_01699]|uniref:hypothetical protein n=1 Tax=Micromonospora sp. NBC_01699 TaxID=2975984 RepID=UPI002E378F34|nr:hypothetical protein [Micromonospora sp. NBC_01699]
MSTLHAVRRSGWLGRAIAVTCAVVLAAGLGTAQATAKPTPAPVPVPDSEVTDTLRVIYSDAADAMRYSLAVAAAEPDRAWPAGSVEAELAAAVRDLSPQRRGVFADSAQTLLADADANFGSYGSLAPADYAVRGFDRVYADSPVPGDAARFGSALKAQHAAGTSTKAAGTTAQRMPAPAGGAEQRSCPTCPPPECDDEIENCDPTPGPTLPKTGIRFMIDRVVCIDETSGPGSDEIAFGGTVVTPAGVTVQVPSYEIPQAFDSGDIWTFYGSGYRFGNFDLPTTYPGVYSASVLLSEVDLGGFANTITAVWQKVQTEVQKKIAEWVGQVLDPIVRSQLIAAALGALAGWLGGELITWIVNSFHDDVFWDVLSSQLTLSSINGPLQSGVFRFEGHGGAYDVHYSWRWRN